MSSLLYATVFYKTLKQDPFTVFKNVRGGVIVREKLKAKWCATAEIANQH
jgi:hypothetical protein